MAKDFNSSTNITTCAVAGVSTQVLLGSGVLERIVVNVSTAVVIAVIDANASTTTATIGTIKKSATTGDYTYNRTVSSGIKITTTGATNIIPDITVVWRQ